MNKPCCLAYSRSSVNCASMLKTWRSSSSLDFLQYIKYLIIASGIKLIKVFALHRQFVISLYIGSRAFGTSQISFEEPPRSGGNAFGGIQNALAGLGGNISPSPCLWRGRGQSFFKFRIVVIIPKSSDSFPAEPRMRHARSAWLFETKSYARTIAPPPPRGLGGNTERKTTPCISDLAGVKFFFEKGKGVFLSGFLPSITRAVGGRNTRRIFCFRNKP